jgi:hypothetical protein
MSALCARFTRSTTSVVWYVIVVYLVCNFRCGGYLPTTCRYDAVPHQQLVLHCSSTGLSCAQCCLLVLLQQTAHAQHAPQVPQAVWLAHRQTPRLTDGRSAWCNMYLHAPLSTCYTLHSRQRPSVCWARLRTARRHGDRLCGADTRPGPR